MTTVRLSLATHLKVVVLLAVNLAIIRWGVRLPNLLANGMIQEIVVGGAPLASLLAYGLMASFRDRTHQGSYQRFWAGFSTFGTGTLGLYVFACLRYGQHVNRYLDVPISGLDRVLRNIGLAERPGEYGFRYGLVIATIVLLLAVPQLSLAVFGGWMVERTPWRSFGSKCERPG